MRKKNVALVAVLIVLLAAIGLAWWRFYIGVPVVGPAPGIGSPEKLAVNVTSYHANRITLQVVGIETAKGNQNITLTAAIIKNLDWSSSWTVNLDNRPAIPIDERPTIVYVDITTVLPSQQQYTITLTTTAGSSFVSPAFTT